MSAPVTAMMSAKAKIAVAVSVPALRGAPGAAAEEVVHARLLTGYIGPEQPPRSGQPHLRNEKHMQTQLNTAIFKSERRSRHLSGRD